MSSHVSFHQNNVSSAVKFPPRHSRKHEVTKVAHLNLHIHIIRHSISTETNYTNSDSRWSLLIFYSLNYCFFFSLLHSSDSSDGCPGYSHHAGPSKYERQLSLYARPGLLSPFDRDIPNSRQLKLVQNTYTGHHAGIMIPLRGYH